MLQQRLDLRGEGEQSSIEVVIEGLYTQPVAGTEQLLGYPVPNNEREHAPKLVDTIGTVLLVCVDDRLGVAMRPIAMACRLQLRTGGGMIKDLTVVNDLE